MTDQYHIYPPDPDDDDSILLDSHEARLRADAQARQLADWAVVASTVDPYPDLYDLEVDALGGQGDIKAMVSRVIRRCRQQIANDTPTYYAEGSREQAQALRDAIYWALSALHDQIKAEVKAEVAR